VLLLQKKKVAMVVLHLVTQTMILKDLQEQKVPLQLMVAVEEEAEVLVLFLGLVVRVTTVVHYLLMDWAEAEEEKLMKMTVQVQEEVLVKQVQLEVLRLQMVKAKKEMLMPILSWYHGLVVLVVVEVLQITGLILIEKKEAAPAEVVVEEH